MDGVLVVDKPVGPTSHDVVARVRRAIGVRRIGHTGTLDPAASGVLPLVVGRATRLARFLSAGDKTYDVTIRLGVSTDTGDARGTPLGPAYAGAPPSPEAIESALDGFRGTSLQQPPAYSAKKIGGTRSHRLARRARRDPLNRVPAPLSVPASPAPPALPALPSPVRVIVHALDILSVAETDVRLRVVCSAGFYVRSLAHDLGERLGTGGHVEALRRTCSAGFTLREAIPLAVVEANREAALKAIVPLAEMLPELSAVVLTPGGVRHAVQGRNLGPEDVADISRPQLPSAAAPDEPVPGRAGWIRLFDEKGRLLGLARLEQPSGILHPAVVLV